MGEIDIEVNKILDLIYSNQVELALILSKSQGIKVDTISEEMKLRLKKKELALDKYTYSNKSLELDNLNRLLLKYRNDLVKNWIVDNNYSTDINWDGFDNFNGNWKSDKDQYNYIYHMMFYRNCNLRGVVQTNTLKLSKTVVDKILELI